MVSAKRTRVQDGASEAKKAKIIDPVAEKIEVITRTLTSLECHVPGDQMHREMLVSCIPYALRVPSDERHEYQRVMAKMAEEVLQAYVAEEEGKVSAHQPKVDLAEKEAREANEELEASATCVAGQEEAVARCQDALDADSEGVRAALEAVELSKNEVADFDRNMQATIEEKERFENLNKECFCTLKLQALDKKNSAQLLKKMEYRLKKIGAQSSLMIALGAASKVSPTDRGVYDIMAFDHTEEMINKHLEALQGQIDNADTHKAENLAALSATQDALQSAKDKEVASEKALNEAKELLGSLDAQRQESYRNSESISSASMIVVTEHGVMNEGLEKAQHALLTFTELFERKAVAEANGKVDDMPDVLKVPSPLKSR